ncbi:hypothetical protein CLV78_101483 [Aliiruegeria haliotis]|uniref:Uncharacterized protein n=1 Tax=Aliiruegeria haliotis TaxID=1280846 RepID=A0A2T0RYZ5_9RHOB|nr:hypothetical protein CLV78_101483 [Aliiruegeria haliotis]
MGRRFALTQQQMAPPELPQLIATEARKILLVQICNLHAAPMILLARAMSVASSSGLRERIMVVTSLPTTRGRITSKTGAPNGNPMEESGLENGTTLRIPAPCQSKTGVPAGVCTICQSARRKAFSVCLLNCPSNL